MKIWKRTLSVGLSLVLCAGMVMPGFAASFSDLQNAIDGNGGTQIGETDRWGYGQKNEETGKWGIEAWGDGDTRNVKLNENVNYGENGSTDDAKSIYIGDVKLSNGVVEAHSNNVVLDLNGCSIDGGYHNANVETGQQAQKGSSSKVIIISKDSQLTLDDSKAEWKTETDDRGNTTEVYISGKITGGFGDGAGVCNRGTFKMKNGSIANNQGNGFGPGGVRNYGIFEMEGGSISCNGGGFGGGVNNQGTFTMTGGIITDNKATHGSGIYNAGTFNIKNGSLTGNRGSSIVKNIGGAMLNMAGTCVIDNEDGSTVVITTHDETDTETSRNTVMLPKNESGKAVVAVVDELGRAIIPAGSVATDKDGNEIDLPFGGTIDKDGNITVNPDPNAGSNTGDNTTGGNTGSSTGSSGNTGSAAAGEDLTTIEAEAVPLAGPVFVEDVLEELYKHEGSPDGEDPEGEYDLAIAWAIANGIIGEEDDEEAFVTVADVEEVVTVATLRYILIEYLDFAGIEYTLAIDGEDGDIVDNCGEILTQLFAAGR